jgi:hypothetical protein
MDEIKANIHKNPQQYWTEKLKRFFELTLLVLAE